MEFFVAVDLYVAAAESPLMSANSEKKFLLDDDKQTKKAFTIHGPPEYTGNILDDPDAVWLEDQWNEERIQEADHAVKQQSIGVPTFWKQKYFLKAGSYWDTFYVRNRDNFYKDRHYLHVVFPELAPSEASHCLTLLEVGCGGKSCLILYSYSIYFN